MEEIRKTAKERKIELHWIDKPALEKLSGNRPHQVVIDSVCVCVCVCV